MPRSSQDVPYLKIRVSAADEAHPDWRPIDVYFRRTASNWQLVGIERGVD
jgi:hypothetical protein